MDKALGRIDRSKLNVNGSSLAAGHPVRGDRRTDRGAAGQAAGREEEGDRPARPRSDFDLRSGWSGRRRDPRGVSRINSAAYPILWQGCNAPAGAVDRPVAPCCRLTPRPDGNTGLLISAVGCFDGEHADQPQPRRITQRNQRQLPGRRLCAKPRQVARRGLPQSLDGPAALRPRPDDAPRRRTFTRSTPSRWARV